MSLYYFKIFNCINENNLIEVCTEFDHARLQKSIKSRSEGGLAIYIYIYIYIYVYYVVVCGKSCIQIRRAS